MALEDHGAVEAWAADFAPIDDDNTGAGFVEASQDIEHRGLAAAGMADDADEFAFFHAEPQVAEHGRGRTSAGWRGKGTRQSLNGDVTLAHCFTPDR